MKLELLSPAGNLEKLNTAFYYGADAAYIGGKNFSLRAFADNFDDSELQNAVKAAKTQGKKIYVTLNIFAKNQDLGAITDYIKYLSSVGVNAVILS
ncbi:MAG: U32 family peptidase, partial [Clostridia bacterium]|nr:U32 family peptidase [Clostridia bacterium]